MVIHSVKCFGHINCTNVGCVPAFDHVVNNQSSRPNSKTTSTSFLKSKLVCLRPPLPLPSTILCRRGHLERPRLLPATFRCRRDVWNVRDHFQRPSAATGDVWNHRDHFQRLSAAAGDVWSDRDHFQRLFVAAGDVLEFPRPLPAT